MAQKSKSKGSEENIVQKIKAEVLEIIERGEKIAAIFQAKHFFMYKHSPGDDFEVAYVCPKCTRSRRTKKQLSMPYTLVCDICGAEIFKQEKVPGKKGRKKKAK